MIWDEIKEYFARECAPYREWLIIGAGVGLVWGLGLFIGWVVCRHLMGECDDVDGWRVWFMYTVPLIISAFGYLCVKLVKWIDEMEAAAERKDHRSGL